MIEFHGDAAVIEGGNNGRKRVIVIVTVTLASLLLLLGLGSALYCIRKKRKNTKHLKSLRTGKSYYVSFTQVGGWTQTCSALMTKPCADPHGLRSRPRKDFTFQGSNQI